MRHQPAKHPSLAERAVLGPRRSLACDDKDDLQPGPLRAIQEAAQRLVHDPIRDPAPRFRGPLPPGYESPTSRRDVTDHPL